MAIWDKAVEEAGMQNDLQDGPYLVAQGKPEDLQACLQNTEIVNTPANVRFAGSLAGWQEGQQTLQTSRVPSAPKTEAEIQARFLPLARFLTPVSPYPGTLSQPEYLKRFEAIVQEMMETTRAKNSDYAGPRDAFANFRAVELLRPGHITTQDGIWVRMTDKWTRLCTLLDKPPSVVSESLQDTLTDLAVYAIILRVWLDFKKEGAAHNA